MLGVNLGSGLSAGGLTGLHQELIMTMPGTGTYARRRVPYEAFDFVDREPSERRDAENN